MQYITQEMRDYEYLRHKGHWRDKEIPAWAQAMLDANPSPGYALVLEAKDVAVAREIAALQEVAQAFLELHDRGTTHLSGPRLVEMRSIANRLRVAWNGDAGGGAKTGPQ